MASAPNTCLFCQILQGSLESSILYQDERCTAFMDIQPVNAGHVLIIPNVHVASIHQLDDETAGHLFVTANRVNRALRRSGIRCEGVNYFLADGEAAFQEVFHAHLHCFPRFRNDGFGLTFPKGYQFRPSREALNQLAALIQKNL